MEIVEEGLERWLIDLLACLTHVYIHVWLAGGARSSRYSIAVVWFLGYSVCLPLLYTEMSLSVILFNAWELTLFRTFSTRPPQIYVSDLIMSRLSAPFLSLLVVPRPNMFERS